MTHTTQLPLLTPPTGFKAVLMPVAAALPAPAQAATLLEQWQSNVDTMAGMHADSVLHGLHGVVVGLVLLTLLLWFSQRRNIHLLNLLMLTGLLIGLVGLDGRGAPGLAAEHRDLLQLIGFSAFGAAGAMLSRRFLELDRHPGWADKLMLGIALSFLLIPAAPALKPELPVLAPALALTLVLAGTATTTGLIGWRTGLGGVLAFQTAWLLILAGSAIAIASSLGALPATLFTSHALQLALTTAMIALAAALSCASRARERLRLYTLDRELAAQSHQLEALHQTEQMLSHQIAQRNHELENANRLLRDTKLQSGTKIHRDPLTGLANRLLLEERVAHGIVRSLRHNAKLALILVDIDGFKSINERFGREFGDELLATIARRLKGIARAEDTVARLGADDFVLLLEDVFDTDDINRTTAAINAELGKPFKIREQKLDLSASIGHAFFPENGKDADNLIKSADRMMYLARSKDEVPGTNDTRGACPVSDHV